jgi:hypothetical protein
MHAKEKEREKKDKKEKKKPVYLSVVNDWTECLK